MRRHPNAYLHDIIAAADSIEAFLIGVDFAEFAENDLLRSAVERKYEIIGEALSQLAKVDPELAGRISRWREIVAFRNIIVHGYASLDYKIVWTARETALPDLRSEVAALLRTRDRLSEA